MLCSDEDKVKEKRGKGCFDSEASDAADLPDFSMKEFFVASCSWMSCGMLPVSFSPR